MNFEEAVMPHMDAAYNLARWLTRNDADAQDMVQEAYLRALRFFGGFRGTDAKAWLLTIVRNTCYTWLRRNRSPELSCDFDEVVLARESEGPDPETEQLMKAQAQLVNDAIEKLPIEFREVVVLRELEELSYKEIAIVLGVPIGTVMSRLARARKRLLLLLQGEDHQERKRRIIMKKTFAKGFITAALLAMAIVVAGVSAQAQTLQYRLTADIPFEFSVSDQKLPAGKYWISRAQEASGDTVLQIQSTDGKSTTNRFSIPVFTFNPKKRGELIFHKYGDQYFLSQVWPAGGGTGRAFAKTHAERTLERDARNNVVGATKAPKAEIVAVAVTIQR
ncbi:MAG TPA: sigma-70 family RNA polymerase sigma factor [Pyrinomonadaceae bacterium]|nr:sigma-70 family RNA polymerase sigma factor [Pyrinomonadaceae bacterium]